MVRVESRDASPADLGAEPYPRLAVLVIQPAVAEPMPIVHYGSVV
jgi:hypothetical protein